MPSENLPWVEKYRPHSIDDVISQESITSTVKKLLASGNTPHMLFYGPAGTGKTSTAVAIAREMYGESYSKQTLELNASDDRGIAVVRNQIKSFASTQQMFQTGLKLIILDEADAMTSSAQFSLRRVIEKYTTNTRFIMICNYVNKIIPALQSRCTKFRFSPLHSETIISTLRDIAAKENVKADDAGLEAIIHLSGGDMRKCINILQATNMSFDHIDEASVYSCTGNVAPAVVTDILSGLLTTTFPEAFKSKDFPARTSANLHVLGIHMMQTEFGYALSDIVTEVHAKVVHLRDLPDDALQALLVSLADLEYDLSLECYDNLQTGALVGMFQVARELTFKALAQV